MTAKKIGKMRIVTIHLEAPLSQPKHVGTVGDWPEQTNSAGRTGRSGAVGPDGTASLLLRASSDSASSRIRRTALNNGRCHGYVSTECFFTDYPFETYFYPLTAPAETPPTIYFWPNTKIMRTGRAVSVISALTKFQLCSNWPKKLYTARVAGPFPELVHKYSGMEKSFQIAIKFKIPL